MPRSSWPTQNILIGIFVDFFFGLILLCLGILFCLIGLLLVYFDFCFCRLRAHMYVFLVSFVCWLVD